MDRRLRSAAAALALAAAGCAGLGAGDDGGSLRLVMEDRYRVGERADVLLVNDTDEPFVYQDIYQSCAMTYRDGSGRTFIIPEGTHCDLWSESRIGPGQTVTLFTWGLEECVVDDWGCVESEPLPPGTYTISGTFSRADEGAEEVRVSATFEIVE